MLWFARATYSPPFALLLPKLLPTTPVHRHVLPAAFFHVAVAVEPTFRQVMARLSMSGEDSVRAEKSAVRERNVRCMLDIVVLEEVLPFKLCKL